jgi:transmembrane sensor
MNARTILLFRKYIKNECNPTELDELLKALKSSKNVDQLDIITNTLWQAINSRTHKFPTDKEKEQWQEEVNRLISRAELRKPRYLVSAKSIYSRMASMAAVAAVVAVLVIGAIQFTYISKNNSNKIELTQADFQYFNTDNKATRHIALADGTKIHLNKGTELRIVANQFNRRQREVWLTGEAFFDVAKNPEKPFIIHTGDMTTTVRGTSFNVKAYPQLGENVISVRSGKVEIGNTTQTYAILTHNKQLTYNTVNKTAQIAESNWEDAAGWQEGRLVLNGAGIEELKLRLLQQFGVKAIIEDDALKGKYISGVFGAESTLTGVMNTICTIHNIHYKIEEDRVMINP